MNLRIVIAGLCLSIFFSCKTKDSSTVDKPVTDTAKPDDFYYPMTQYIQSQISYVDSTPLAIEKQTFINNRRVDSVIIDRHALRQLATDFMQPDLTLPSVGSLYKVSQFHDQTINTLTFSYTAIDPNQPIQQRDILLDPNTQKVKTVLFKKIEQRGDTTITENGLWQHNMNFQLNYIIEPKNGPMQTKQIKVIWDRPMARNEEE